MVNEDEAADDAPADTSQKRSDWMVEISKQFGSRDRDLRGAPPTMSSGDRAALRRMDLKREHVVDVAVIKLLTEVKIPRHVQMLDWQRWRMIAHIAAILSGTGKLTAHAPFRRFGAVLNEAGYSENRLLRLLSTHGDALYDQVYRATRIIAQKGKQPVDLWTMYHLLDPDQKQAERVRIRIAQDYYTAEVADKGDVE